MTRTAAPRVDAESSAEAETAFFGFHPLIARWFRSRFEAPTQPQEEGWPHIADGGHTLIAAPTGSGKTLTAFLACIDRLLRESLAQGLEDEIRVVYVSPLRALSNDMHRNLEVPLEEINALAEADFPNFTPIRAGLRTGDTSSSERARLVRKPPQILVTTPESLYLLLTAEKSREKLHRVETVIVDEIHALVRDKRGSHLSLTLERLDAVTEKPLQRIGLSATQKPIERTAEFLVGVRGGESAAGTDCTIVDVGHQRDLDLAIETPASELGAVCMHEQWAEVNERIVELINSHRSTLIFVNTRRLAERLTYQLTELLGEDQVGSHHGSLSSEIRLKTERRLKAGTLKAVVATASLELGLDVGYIDLVIQIGSPRSIATFLQRIGRSGHSLGLVPKGRLFALTRDQAIECMALMRAVRSGRLDMVPIPVAPLDVLAQQIVAEVAAEEWGTDELFDRFRQAAPYRNLSRKDFDRVVEFLSEGIAKATGRSRVYLHHDHVGKRLRARKGARIAAASNAGAIPEIASFRVVAEPDNTVVGSVDEDFALESMAGAVFLLGNTSWRIQYVRGGDVTVVDAQGAPPTIPFWLGEAPGRTVELSEEVSRLREELETRIANVGVPSSDGPETSSNTNERTKGGHSADDRECPNGDQPTVEHTSDSLKAGHQHVELKSGIGKVGVPSSDGPETSSNTNERTQGGHSADDRESPSEDQPTVEHTSDSLKAGHQQVELKSGNGKVGVPSSGGPETSSNTNERTTGGHSADDRECPNGDQPTVDHVSDSLKAGHQHVELKSGIGKVGVPSSDGPETSSNTNERTKGGHSADDRECPNGDQPTVEHTSGSLKAGHQHVELKSGIGKVGVPSSGGPETSSNTNERTQGGHSADDRESPSEDQPTVEHTSGSLKAGHQHVELKSGIGKVGVPSSGGPETSSNTNERTTGGHSADDRECSNGDQPTVEHTSDSLKAGHQPRQAEIVAWLARETNCSESVAGQIIEYVAAQKAAIGLLPTQKRVVFERFFDETGGMQIVVHAPFGGEINRAWGLAMRKRFCRSYDFELQATADDEGFILSIGPQHSFPLESLFPMLTSRNAGPLLEQAVLAVPMFQMRWRWNVTRALLVLRRQMGKKVPPALQRFRADDLMTAVFPRLTGCQEEHTGDIPIPDHPLVRQTVADCLHEAVHLDGLKRILEDIERGDITLVARDTREPSPFCYELLNSNPYAFLDGGEIQERRARAVSTRRSVTVESVDDLGRLDPEAIAQVRAEAAPFVRSADELHDVLLSRIVLPVDDESLTGSEGNFAAGWYDELQSQGRATTVRLNENRAAWVATERLPAVRAVFPEVEPVPDVRVPESVRQKWDSAEARVAIVRGLIEICGPTTAGEIAARVAITESQANAALEALEGEGVVLRGRFHPPPAEESASRNAKSEIEWCHRRLLARIHRLTLQGLRRQIEPVDVSVFMRFLFRHHGLDATHRRSGANGLYDVIAMLQGIDMPAVCWERDLLPARLDKYETARLDEFCLTGEVGWGRLNPAKRDPERSKPMASLTRVAPLSLFLREDAGWLIPESPHVETESLSSPSRQILELLDSRGAMFATDLLGESRMLPGQLDEALGELVTRGFVTADGFGGLRRLIAENATSSRRGRRGRTGLARRRQTEVGSTGRWSLWRSGEAAEPEAAEDEEAATDDRDFAMNPIEQWAWQLLRRWGVVFRDLLAREPCAPRWWELLQVYRRLEARGEIRGGRFVSGVGGEQFAVADTIKQLRQLRDEEPPGEVTVLCAADPLNLVGILTDHPRVSSTAANRVAYRDGVPLAKFQAGEVSVFGDKPVELPDEIIQRLSGKTVVSLRKPSAADDGAPQTDSAQGTDNAAANSRQTQPRYPNGIPRPFV